MLEQICQEEQDFYDQPIAAQLLDIAYDLNRTESREYILDAIRLTSGDVLQRGLYRMDFAMRFFHWSEANPGKAFLSMVEDWDTQQIQRELE